jgi:two-component system cell cycle response regulator
LDHFKKVNDSYGHAAGDQVLKSVTQLVCSMLRSADVFGRYGGEEFVILLPMTNAQEAYTLAERIRKNVELLRVPSENGAVVVTLSTGIVELVHNSQPDTVESLIRDADSLMYSAKQAGRNRIAINA